MSAPDVVPVALDIARINELISDYLHSHSSGRPTVRKAIVDYFTAHDAALRARIDGLEAQLFIAQANAALPLYEVMGFGPMPAFPSIRGAP